MYEVPVELRSRADDGSNVLHARAKAILAEELPQPPAFEMPVGLEADAYPRTVDAAYNEVLFHGLDFHGLREIIGHSDKGMVARTRPAPPPDQWMTDPLRTEWLTEPLALDVGYQMGILWCFEQTGSVCLPASSARYRQYRPGFPADGCPAVPTVQPAESPKLVAAPA